jgi:transcriptional regulator with XRE-family HTH domain
MSKAGSHIKSKRLRTGMSLRKFSAYTGISLATLYRIEGGQQISFSSAKLLAKSIGKTPTWYMEKSSHD